MAVTAQPVGVMAMGAIQRRRDAARDDRAARALVLRSASPEETHALGERLGRLLDAGDIVLLTGGLGAGKTALAQGIARGLGVAGPVSSPTFTILKEHAQGRIPLYHFDLYRIEHPDELEALGFDDYFYGEGVSVVEWAEHGEDDQGNGLWPEDALRISITAAGAEARVLGLSAAGPRGAALRAGMRGHDGEEEEGR